MKLLMHILSLLGLIGLYYRFNPKRDYYSITYSYILTLDKDKIMYYFKNNLYLRAYLPVYNPNNIELCAHLAALCAKEYHKVFIDFTDIH